MIAQGTIWGFFGPPGIRELLVVAVVTLVLYGRSGVQTGLKRTRYGRVLAPFFRPTPQRPVPAQSKKRSRWGDRWFLLLTITAAAAAAAWVVTRMMIASSNGTLH